jgi:hypothetical protein
MDGVITMSKYYWQRGDSAVAYIYTARQLSKRLKTSCANVNHKKYTFYGLQDLSRYSSELVKLCFMVNRMNLNDPLEAQKRQLLLKEARGMLDTIVSLFGECDDIIGFSDGVLEEVSTLMEKEDRLLAGLQKSDTERRKASK